MPIKSKAQRNKFRELLGAGKITLEQYDEAMKAAQGKRLPQRVGTTSLAAMRKYHKGGL